MKKDDNCIFCKLISGEIPTDFLYEDDKFVAFFDKFPSTMGHILIVPKEHVKNLFELTDDIMSDILKVAKKMAIALKEVLGIEAINMLQNNGLDAGQTVDHYHIHLIPRKIDDSISILWEQQTVSDEQFKELSDKIKKFI